MKPVNCWLQEARPVEMIENAPRYFPLETGRYEIKPGMVPLGYDFGNGQIDQQVFQFDRNFPHYRQMKQMARAERLTKYYQTCNYRDEVAGAIARFIARRLTQEHPQWFHAEQLKNGSTVLHCRQTGETLYLDETGQLQDVQLQLQPDAEPGSPPYVSALDALAAQVQEDLTVVCREGEHHWVSAIHLCFPNHWAAEAKIGRDFSTVHAPVAGMEKISQQGTAIVNTMITRRPTVRFAWGISTDARLNHHPEAPPQVPISTWHGRSFDPFHPRLYLRIERQVIWGFPHQEAALFTIRGYFRDCQPLKQDPLLRTRLVSAIESMTPKSLIYKGLAEDKAIILAWLND
ncbi:DUF3445 domain-containing protein [Leptothermofonsia sichuanensis E412]|uniref:heme-dependent oxidative N-demethylase family protein n=1 Tax=Leptothermofonsia sichuanensis TaxID=2917832 RepID=UPI001CA795BF|nr:DUF3445 domain-containing protein [Leptothermofonsia sichuanensis]QZZ20300.1 DUF3445 domain-containing protein [Leptothermofonsia sichuanensis E412]